MLDISLTYYYKQGHWQLNVLYLCIRTLDAFYCIYELLPSHTFCMFMVDAFNKSDKFNSLHKTVRKDNIL